ncbi:MAG TPA: hypothetical protein VFQ38_12210 [Longimicrobiales bacterium]|nr:hypothetical protein [Longimicrobiales bacterium]
MTRLELLTAPLEGLSIQQRVQALIHARELGLEIAEAAAPQELHERVDAGTWLRRVVDPAIAAGVLAPDAAQEWRRRCRGAEGLTDPRVVAFLFGWYEHSLLRMGEVRGDPVILE